MKILMKRKTKRRFLLKKLLKKSIAHKIRLRKKRPMVFKVLLKNYSLRDLFNKLLRLKESPEVL